MANSDYILVLYYSKHGSVLNLARQIAKGVELNGLEAKIRSVGNACGDHPTVTNEELEQCAGLAMGSPCHFGMMNSELKRFWENTSNQWLQGKLIDKPACVFTSSSSFHGGNESTLLNMAIPLLHHGMVLVGIPYSEPELHQTQSGGAPYGATHISGLSSDDELTNHEKQLAIALGKRLCITAKKLNN